MNSTIDPEAPEELDPEDPEEGEEEEDDEDDEERPDTLVQDWETSSGIVFELHGLEDHDEVLIVESYEDDEPPPDHSKKDQIVGIALCIDDLEECMDIMKQIHKKMVERQLSRSPKMKPAPK